MHFSENRAVSGELAASFKRCLRPIMAAPRIVSCPRCGAQVEWSTENRYRPFCSERCKVIDLGQWASEAYRVPEAPAKDPESDAQQEPGRDADF